MNTGAKIKALRKAKGMNAETLALACNVSPATIYRYEKGDIENMGIDKLKPIAAALGTTPAYLMGWEKEPLKLVRSSGPADVPFTRQALRRAAAARRAEARPEEPDGVSPLPTLERKPRLGSIACGLPILAEENIEGYDFVPDWVNCDFTLTCKGDSMIGARIFDGDVVCIRRQPTVENGEIAAVMVDGDEATLKRVRKFDDRIVLEPENPGYRPLVFWDADMDKVRILGKATYFISTVR